MSLRKNALFVLLVATLVFIGCKPTEGSTNTPTDTTPVVNITDIKLNETSLKITDGFTKRLIATLEGEDVDKASITWTVSGTAVSLSETTTKTSEATTVKAERPGKAAITASAGDKEIVCQVTVNEALQIGDIIVQTFSPDGKPKGWKSYTYPDMRIISQNEYDNIIAVIAYINDKGEPIGIGMDMKNNSEIGTKAWCTSDSNTNVAPADKIRNVSNIVPTKSADTGYYTSATDGEQNFAEIKLADPSRTASGTGTGKIGMEYPAFGAVENYAADTDTRIKDNNKLNKGWYIPSMRELQGIFDNKEKLEQYAEIDRHGVGWWPMNNLNTGMSWVFTNAIVSSNQWGIAGDDDTTNPTKKKALTLKWRDHSGNEAVDGPKAAWHGEIGQIDKTESTNPAYVLPVRKFTDPD